MTRKTAAILRQAFLIVVIVLDVMMLASWWLGGHIVFFWVFIAINVAVIVGEIVNYVTNKLTLSTQVTNEVEKGGKRAFFSWAAVILLVLTLTALAAHLLIHVRAS